MAVRWHDNCIPLALCELAQYLHVARYLHGTRDVGTLLARRVIGTVLATRTLFQAGMMFACT